MGKHARACTPVYGARGPAAQLTSGGIDGLVSPLAVTSSCRVPTAAAMATEAADVLRYVAGLSIDALAERLNFECCETNGTRRITPFVRDGLGRDDIDFERIFVVNVQNYLEHPSAQSAVQSKSQKSPRRVFGNAASRVDFAHRLAQGLLRRWAAHESTSNSPQACMVADWPHVSLYARVCAGHA